MVGRGTHFRVFWGVRDPDVGRFRAVRGPTAVLRVLPGVLVLLPGVRARMRAGASRSGAGFGGACCGGDAVRFPCPWKMVRSSVVVRRWMLAVWMLATVCGGVPGSGPRCLWGKSVWCGSPRWFAVRSVRGDGVYGRRPPVKMFGCTSGMRSASRRVVSRVLQVGYRARRSDSRERRH